MPLFRRRQPQPAPDEFPPGLVATYSAILDDDTCAACSALDGREFVTGSRDYLRHRPPNPKCRSELDGCRCVYILDLIGPA